ncbi:hypothetical protein Pst134EB_002017 [Puccinia striiformis f. sp. tritici]|nr:hypothetical protein Pst134EB_002017 [Puccinia striiformis f. sp. tritici]
MVDCAANHLGSVTEKNMNVDSAPKRFREDTIGTGIKEFRRVTIYDTLHGP